MDVLCIYALWDGEESLFMGDPRLLASYLFKVASPGARQQVEHQLRFALKIRQEKYIKYIPCISTAIGIIRPRTTASHSKQWMGRSLIYTQLP